MSRRELAWLFSLEKFHSEFAGKLTLSLLRQSEVVADPYPLYRRMRIKDPVHWDQAMDAWILTRYADVATALRHFLEGSVWTLEQTQAVATTTFADIMLRSLLHLNVSEHTRVRMLAAQTFTGARLALLRAQLQTIANRLIDTLQESGQIDVIADFAAPLPTIFMAEALTAPPSDYDRLSKWSANFTQMLDDFRDNPGRAWSLLRSFEEMLAYIREAVERHPVRSTEGLIHSLLSATIEGRGLTEEEVIVEFVAMTAGGYKMAVGLIANAVLTLLRHPQHCEKVLSDSRIVPAVTEELLRYESPRQYAVRFAPDDLVLQGKRIRKHHSVIAVLGAANRDPEYFVHPDEFDFNRANNIHLAFNWAPYSLVSAELVRIQGQIAIETLLRRFSRLQLTQEPLVWRDTSGFRELVALPITYSASKIRKLA